MYRMKRKISFDYWKSCCLLFFGLKVIMENIRTFFIQRTSIYYAGYLQPWEGPKWCILNKTSVFLLAKSLRRECEEMVYSRGLQEMSSVLAGQYRPRIWAQMIGEGGVAGVSTDDYSCTPGAQINFGDLTLYLAYDLFPPPLSLWTASIASPPQHWPTSCLSYRRRSRYNQISVLHPGCLSRIRISSSRIQGQKRFRIPDLSIPDPAGSKRHRIRIRNAGYNQILMPCCPVKGTAWHAAKCTYLYKQESVYTERCRYPTICDALLASVTYGR